MTDPRVAFEEWYAADAMPAEADWFKRDPDDRDEYDSGTTHCAWRAWQAAIKHEREECAKVCTDLWHTLCDRDADIGELSVAGDCAYLIRTRGAPPPPVEGQGLDG